MFFSSPLDRPQFFLVVVVRYPGRPTTTVDNSPPAAEYTNRVGAVWSNRGDRGDTIDIFPLDGENTGAGACMYVGLYSTVVAGRGIFARAIEGELVYVMARIRAPAHACTSGCTAR